MQFVFQYFMQNIINNSTLDRIKLQQTDQNKQDMLSNNVNVKLVEWPRIYTL